MSPYTVLVDDREDNNRVEAINRRKDLVAQVQRLEVGDVLFGELCVEVKELGDFLGSFCAGDRKGYRQLFDMNENYAHPVLAVIGDFDAYMNALRSNVPKYRYMKGPQWGSLVNAKRKSYHAALNSIALKRQVGVLQFPTVKEFTDWLVVAVKREGNGKRESSRPIITSKNSSRSLKDEAEDALCALTGLGRVASKSVLSAFLSLNGVATASVEELCMVDGVGPKTAQHIHDVFNASC